MYCLQNLVHLDWCCFEDRLYIPKTIMVPNTEPCGTPTSTPSQSDSCPPKLTNCFLSVKYDFIKLCIFPFIPIYSNLSNKIFLSTQSKALLKSNKTAQTAFPLSKEDNVFSTNSERAKVVECPSLKPN